jgi:hypothetical protein
MPPRTGVKVKLGGKQRTIRYTAVSLSKLEDERAGEALTRTLYRAGQVSIGAIGALVWAGLLHDEPDLTVEEATEMIEPPLPKLIDGLMEALDPWTVGAEEGEEGNDKAAD